MRIGVGHRFGRDQAHPGKSPEEGMHLFKAEFIVNKGHDFRRVEFSKRRAHLLRRGPNYIFPKVQYYLVVVSPKADFVDPKGS